MQGQEFGSLARIRDEAENGGGGEPPGCGGRPRQDLRTSSGEQQNDFEQQMRTIHDHLVKDTLPMGATNDKRLRGFRGKASENPPDVTNAQESHDFALGTAAFARDGFDAARTSLRQPL